jgi:hypothetical protein
LLAENNSVIASTPQVIIELIDIYTSQKDSIIKWAF